MARRARRTRMGKNRNAVVDTLKTMASNDMRIIMALAENNRNYAFGRLLTKWMPDSNESVIDAYVDEEAKDAVGYALNIIAKQIQEAKGEGQ